MAISMHDIVQRVVLEAQDAVRDAHRVSQAVRGMGSEMTEQSAKVAVGSKVMGRALDDVGDEAQGAKRDVAALNRELRELAVTQRLVAKSSVNLEQADLRVGASRKKLNALFQDGNASAEDLRKGLLNLRSAELSLMDAQDRHGKVLGGLGRETRKLKSDLDALDGGGGRKGKSNLSQIAGGFGKIGSSVGGLGMAFKLLLIPGIIAGIAELLNVVSALAGGLVAMTGAMMPAVGAIASLPAVLFTAVLGFSAIKAAISGVSDAMDLFGKAKESAADPKWARMQADASRNLATAQSALTKAYSKEDVNGMIAAKAGVTAAQREQTDITRQATAAQKEYQAALNKMDPSVGTFIKTLDRIKPQFEGVKKAAQGGLFPGLTEALNTISTPQFIGTLKTIFKPITAAVGQFVADLAKMFASDRWQQALRAFGDDTVKAIRVVGGALIDMLEGMRAVGIAARPLTRWFGELTTQLFSWFKVMSVAGQESGRLTGFLVKTRDVLTTMGRTLSNFGSGIYQVFSVGANLGRDIGDSFEELNNRFRKWAHSAEGQRKINEYFEAIRPILYELSHLFGAIFRGMGMMVNDMGDGTAGLIAKLRTELGPELLKIFTGFNSTFGPALVDLIVAAARVFATIAGETGPLLLLVGVLKSVFEGLVKIIDTGPGMKQLFLVVLSLAAAFKIFRIGAVISGFQMLALSLFKVVAPAQAATAAVAATAAGTKVSLLTMFKAIPPQVLLVIGALTLLTVGLVKLYKSNEQFRTAVLSTWRTIVAVVGPIVRVIGQLLADLATWMSENIVVAGALGTVILLSLVPALKLAAVAFLQMAQIGTVLVLQRIVAVIAQIAAFAGLSTGGLVLLTLGVVQVIKTFADATRHAKEMRAEIDKKFPTDTWDGLNANLQHTGDLIKEQGKEFAKRNNLWGNVLGGLQSMVPFITHTIVDQTKALDANLDAWIANNAAKARIEATLASLARNYGITIEQARALYVQLKLPIDTPLPEVAAAIAKLRVETIKAKGPTTALGKAYADLAAAGNDVVDMTRAYSDALNAIIDPLFDAESAQTAFDEAINGTTSSLDKYGDATNKINTDWADAQKQAALDLAEANKALAGAEADLLRAYSKEDVAGMQTAKDAVEAARLGVGTAADASKKAAVRPTADTTSSEMSAAAAAADFIQGKLKPQILSLIGKKNRGEIDEAELEKQVAALRPKVLKYLKNLNLTPAEVQKYMNIFDNVENEIKVMATVVAPTPSEAARIYASYQGALDKYIESHPQAKIAIQTALNLPDQPVTGASGAAAVAGVAANAPASPAATDRGLARDDAVINAQKALDDFIASHPIIIGGADRATLEELRRNLEDALTTQINARAVTTRFPTSPTLEHGDIIRAESGRPPMTSDKPILWAEGRDTEAYIPYDRQYRTRSIGLLGQVASDFGLAVVPRSTRPFSGGGVVPHYAIGTITDRIQRAAMGTLTAASAIHYARGGFGGGGGGSSSSHVYDIKVDAVDRPTGEQLGRDMAWGITQARGRASSRSDR